MQVFDTLRLVLTTPLTDAEVARSTGLSPATVRRYRRLADQREMVWGDVSQKTPSAIRGLFNRKAGRPAKAVPDLQLLHDRLQEKGVTLHRLWAEYVAETPDDALSYTQLAAKLQAFRATLPETMRQSHPPGERASVDYSGERPFYFNVTTQEKVFVELFVGVLNSSSLIFATCTPSQKVPDFIEAHVRMLAYFGGAPMVLVPDNLKSAVVRAGKRPVIQRSYADLARHYGCAVMPARPYRPQDKAVAEVSVKLVQQGILVSLRSQRFYSIDDLNEAVARELEVLNARPMKKDGRSRRKRFELLDKLALRPLPMEPYEYAEWVPVPTVPKDYHISVQGHFYSVPHRLIGQSVEARVLRDRVEMFHDQRLVASHTRSSEVGNHTTTPSHQPDAHRAQAERSPEGMRLWAKRAGPAVLRLVMTQLDQAQPFLGMPACEELKALSGKHGTVALERACQNAFDLRTPTLTTVKRVLAEAATNTKGPPRSRFTVSAKQLRGGASC
jgi:transposase